MTAGLRRLFRRSGRAHRALSFLTMSSVTLAVFAGSAVLLASDAHAQGTIQNIKHVIIIMQENRSFDEYFGMYPGANGIPVDGNGNPTVCSPDQYTGVCVHPYHDPSNSDQGGGHGPDSVPADEDIVGGVAKMDGYVGQYYNHWKINSCPIPNSISPDATCSDVMGYKNGSDIPNYWDYAQNYVLQDGMYESIPSWSRTSHVAMVSGWSATCPAGSTNPLTCKSALATGDHYDDTPEATGDCDDYDPIPSGCGVPDYAWTDVTYLLHKYGVSWTYYTGTDTPEMWKPLGDFQDVHSDGQAQAPGSSSCCFQYTSDFMNAASSGTLPAVSWVIPGHAQSDHPSLAQEALVSDSQAYVTQLIDAVMAGPDWSSSAIFLAWDDWGGFYDHMTPPTLAPSLKDVNGVGLRVPGLLISPYAKQGYIDNQTLTFDSYLRFIEDDFLNGCRLTNASTPETCDDRPDDRPDVRETQFGDLQQEFDFTQSPRPPMLLPLLNTSAQKVSAGNTVKLTGSNFAPNETVSFNLGVLGSDCWDPGCPTSASLGTTTTDSTGSFKNVVVTAPTGDSGNYAIGAVGSTGDAGGINQDITKSTGNQPPKAAVSVSPSSGQAPLNVTANASASVAGSTPISSYSFDFGDGTVLGQQASPIATHTYTEGGVFTVVVTVTDQDNLTSNASAQVVVGSPNLVINPGFEDNQSIFTSDTSTRFTATGASDATLPAWISNQYVGDTVTAGGSTGVVAGNDTTGDLTITSAGWSTGTPTNGTTFSIMVPWNYGWKAGSGTTLAQSTTAHSGTYSAQLTRTTTAGRATLNDSPVWNNNTEAATTCTVSAWMQGPAGGKLNAQEVESLPGGTGEVAHSVKAVKSVGGAWQEVTVKLVIVNSGDWLQLAFFTTLQPGQQMLIDDVSETCQ